MTSFNLKSVSHIFKVSIILVLLSTTLYAQQNSNIHFAENSLAHKEPDKVGWQTASFTRLWFSDTIGYIFANIPLDNSLRVSTNDLDPVKLKNLKEEYSK